MSDENELHQELKDIPMEDFFTDEEDDDMKEVHSNLAKVQLKTPNRDNIQFQPVALRPLNIVAEGEDSVFLLRSFYQRFFPYKSYFNWLNYENGKPTRNFTHREFSFTLTGDIYIRFKSFGDIDEFRKEIERLQPIKIDIGAIYSIKPKDKKTVSEKAFRPLEKEFVIDIDMTDYDDIRTCCTGGDICGSCWNYMTIAIKILDACLRDDFGFNHLLWVYSGRRGVHCWVSDQRARVMNNECRKAIVGYMEVIKDVVGAGKKVRLPATLHPSTERSLKLIKPYFVKHVLNGQGVLDTQEHWKKLLSLISDKDIIDRLDKHWESDPSLSGASKWEELMQELKKSSQDKPTTSRDIIFQYCYPRLDDKVSTNINHLLKSPFCVHPKTQRVCVPIDPSDCDSFDPLSIPTTFQLSKELNEYVPSPSDSDRKIPDYKKTSLKPYIELFDKFVNGVILENQREKRDIALNSMEF
ncbi:unnamed protein product [Cunninghamella echinulata]